MLYELNLIREALELLTLVAAVGTLAITVVLARRL